jgi:hypothetical protein
LSLTVTLFVLLISSAVTYLWLFGDESTLLSPIPEYWFIPGGILFQLGQLTGMIRVVGLLISALAIAPLIFALWQLRRLFQQFSVLRIFVPETVRRMKVFSVLVICFAVMQPILGSVMSLATSLGNEPGQRFLSVSFAGTDLATLLIGGSVFVIVYIMEEALKLNDENEKFV